MLEKNQVPPRLISGVAPAFILAQTRYLFSEIWVFSK